RAMMDTPKLLIIDETSTALSSGGRDILYRILKDLAARGSAVIFISHDLDELIEHCDVLTVLRDGVLIDHLEKDQMEQGLIKSLMVGRELSEKFYREDFGEDLAGEVALRAENISSQHVLENVSFELRYGEVLGIGGLAGGGIHDFGNLLFGAEEKLTGKITVYPSGAEINNIRDAITNKIGYMSKNRDEEVLVLKNTIKKNLTCSANKLLSRFGFITGGSERKFAQEQIDHFQIKCWSMEQDTGTLSGGNKQKVAFGKWVGNGSEILIMDCPTRGVDVGVKATMYQLIDDLRRSGKAILLIAEEMPELIGMSDRILIIKHGHIAAEFKRDDRPTEHDLINYMI
ncbi:MAG: ATP-binding cassette domain-containing protein, partial [Oscillospiraceae bacterium]|nr:ATP-binding cassette domain-containing protein [Oscillospiraceae bacterium]